MNEEIEDSKNSAVMIITMTVLLAIAYSILDWGH